MVALYAVWTWRKKVKVGVADTDKIRPVAVT